VRGSSVVVTVATLFGVLSACSGASDVTAKAPIASSAPATAKPRPTFDLPAVGAHGFPARAYPKAGPGGGGSIPGCPDSRGLDQFSGTAPARAVVVWATVLTQTFPYDLHHTDRAWWSTIRADWRSAQQHGSKSPASASRIDPDGILYAGPLRTTPQFGVPRQYGFLKHWCGTRLADRSYAVVSGPRDGPALQGVSVFLNRNNHVLLYYEYP